MVILKYNRNGYLLRQESLLGHPRLDALPTANPVRRDGLLTIDAQQPSLYYALNNVTAGLQAAGGEAVQAFSCFVGVHLEAPEGHGIRGGGPLCARSRRPSPPART